VAGTQPNSPSLTISRSAPASAPRAPRDGALDRGLHVGAAVEGLAHQLEQRVQAFGVVAPARAPAARRAAEGDQQAAALAGVRAAQGLQHAGLGQRFGRAAHRARGVQADDQWAAPGVGHCAVGLRLRAGARALGGRAGAVVVAQQLRFGKTRPPQAAQAPGA
jgi:hypothetical protein